MGARTQKNCPPKSLFDAVHSRTLLLTVVVALAVTAVRGGAQQNDVTAARIAQLVVRMRAAQVDEATRTEARAAAYALIGAARYEDALSLFGALLERQPRDASALYGAALANFNLQRIADAEQLDRTAVEELSHTADPSGALRNQHADALVLLAVIEAVKGDNAAALATVQTAVKLAPRHFDAQFTLGRALYGAGDPAAAATAFRAAVALRPDDARARFFLATALERAGDEAGALTAYRELVARAPTVAEGHIGLGVLLVKLGGDQLAEGVRELERAIALNPDAYEARVTLGRTLIQQGQSAAAVEHLKRAAELAPNNPEPHYQLALAYRRLGRSAEAAAESGIVKQIHEARRQTRAQPTRATANND